MENDMIKNKILEMLKISPDGILITILANKLGYSRQTIAKYVMELKGERKIIIRPIGPGKMIYLKKR